MFSTIASYMIFGMPVIGYGGIVTFLCLLVTASISTMNKRKIRIIHMKWHHRMAYVTIAFGLVHGSLSFLALLGL
jgi:hypothetical protein